jgi:hypothetical protein
MVSSAITPTRTIAVLIGVAVIAVAGFAVVRSGVFEPETVQGAIPGPGSSSPSASVSAPRSPSASPSPTLVPSSKPTTPKQIRAQNIADAKARLVEYYETTAAVANSGYLGWEKQLSKFWGHPAIAASLETVYEESAASGQYTTGAASVESSKLVRYEPDDASFERVTLDVCIDFSEVKTFEEDGTEIARSESIPTRYMFTYVMLHQGVDGVWTVNDEERHVGRAC